MINQHINSVYDDFEGHDNENCVHPFPKTVSDQLWDGSHRFYLHLWQVQ